MDLEIEKLIDYVQNIYLIKIKYKIRYKISSTIFRKNHNFNIKDTIITTIILNFIYYINNNGK